MALCIRPRFPSAVAAAAVLAAAGPASAAERRWLLDREDKRDEALAAYGRAAAAGSDNFYVYYRRASLMWRSRPPRETVVQIATLLEQATRLNPEHAWSQDSLARALAETDPGERAVAAARKAVSLEPSVASHRLALVQALWTASQEADARRELQTARALASEDRDRQSVQEWLDFMDRARPR